ncbi:MAG: DUF2857 family protein [Rhodocyclaceae bacterium]|nr:DUF2857 family protein [Rhodocyclaceae bacterium]MBX3670355.1 DUF2857 family protein [Rhodocyclaceae bacterium]
MLVENTEIRRELLLHLIQLVKRGELTEAMKCGLPPKDLDELSQMTDLDVAALASEPALHVSFQIDPDEFARALVRSRRSEADQRALMYYFRHGASINMFWRHFKLSKRAVNEFRRQRLLVAPSGRPPVLPEPCALRLLARYRALPPEMSERDRFIRLHQEFQGAADAPNPLPLATLYNALAAYF